MIKFVVKVDGVDQLVTHNQKTALRTAGDFFLSGTVKAVKVVATMKGSVEHVVVNLLAGEPA